MLGAINEPVAYYFPTKDSLAQFIKKYGKEIVNSKGMGKNYGFAGCDTYTFRRSKDNIHLLMEVDPQFGIHKAVKMIQGRTSRIFRQGLGWLRSRLPSLWTNSNFVSTDGGAPLSVIKQYIENQKNV